MNTAKNQDIQLPFTTIFSRLADNLNILREHVDELENNTRVSAYEPRTTQKELIRAFQSFDYILQSLDDLILLSSNLGSRDCSNGLPQDHCHGLAMCLKLSQSQALLSPFEIDNNNSDQLVAAGEPIFFSTL